jgi:hypothetical protein
MASKFQKVGFRTALLLATSLLALQALRTHDFKTFSLSDFGEYWAAGRLLLAHSNPYSPPALLALQSSVGFSEHDAIMMWNPHLGRSPSYFPSPTCPMKWLRSCG